MNVLIFTVMETSQQNLKHPRMLSSDLQRNISSKTQEWHFLKLFKDFVQKNKLYTEKQRHVEKCCHW